MRSRGAGVPPWMLWGLACCGPVLLTAAGIGAVVVGSPVPDWTTFAQNIYPNIVFGSVVPLLGALMLSRLPGHPIGRLYLFCGLASAVTLPTYAYARLALYDHPGGMPLGTAAAWVSAWVWALGFIPLVTIGVLLFPDGRLPSTRWRPVLALDFAAVVLAASATAFRPGGLENHRVADNPLGLPLPRHVFDVMAGVAVSLFLVGLTAAGAATVLRWRRSAGDERAQLAWFALPVLLLVLAIVVPTPAGLGDIVAMIAVPLLPIAVTVAIMRHRLLGIELVVRRSLVYGALSALLLLTYAVTVVALGTLLRGRADAAAALVATALVAVAFSPIRARLQSAADRLVYGQRSDPYAVLSGLGLRLHRSVDPDDDALGEVASAVAASLRLPYVRVTIQRPGDEPLVAEHGAAVSTGTHEVSLAFRSEPVGSLLAAPRTPRDPFRAADLRILEDLGRQIGVAAHAMLLTRDLQRSREELVALREDERRRIRRDLHDGLGPALAGVALGLDAVHRIALEDPAGAAELAEQLKREVHASLSEVRRLVEDLRPPALDQLGLVGAVRQQAERLTERDPGLRVVVEAEGVPALPAAVEVAAYRIATEALNNVSRHAVARLCRVGIAMSGKSALLIEIEDDGIGLPASPRPGVGLTAMRERATELGGSWSAASDARGGTRVQALLPVVAL